MNKLNIVNELRRCAEPSQAGWNIWYHGAYLGSIVKIKAGQYLIHRDETTKAAFRQTYMAAISSFVDAAYEVYKADYKEFQESQPVIRSIGVNKAQQKTLWQRVKGWFK